MRSWTPRICGRSKGAKVDPSNPTRCHPDRRQPQRRHRTPAVDRRDPTDSWTAWTATPPGKVNADRGYDHDKYRCLVRQRGITPAIARRGQPHGSSLGQQRWVVERGFAWLHALKTATDPLRTPRHIHEAFLTLACSVICLRAPTDQSEATFQAVSVRTTNLVASARRFSSNLAPCFGMLDSSATTSGAAPFGGHRMAMSLHVP